MDVSNGCAWCLALVLESDLLEGNHTTATVRACLASVPRHEKQRRLPARGHILNRLDTSAQLIKRALVGIVWIFMGRFNSLAADIQGVCAVHGENTYESLFYLPWGL